MIFSKDSRLKSHPELMSVVSRLESDLLSARSRIPDAYREGFELATALFMKGMNPRTLTISMEYVQSVQELARVCRKCHK